MDEVAELAHRLDIVCAGANRQHLVRHSADEMCPVPSCDECPERGTCTAEENCREKTANAE